MKTTELRQKLHHYIEVAEEKKLKAIFTMVEDEINDTYDLWQDESFVAELRSRERAFLEGRMNTFSLEQTVANVKRSIKRKRRS